MKHALRWPCSLKHFQGTPRILKKTIWETLIESPCYVVEVASKLLPKVTELIEVQPGLECLTCLGWLLVLKKDAVTCKVWIEKLSVFFPPSKSTPTPVIVSGFGREFRRSCLRSLPGPDDSGIRLAGVGAVVGTAERGSLQRLATPNFALLWSCGWSSPVSCLLELKIQWKCDDFFFLLPNSSQRKWTT